MTQKHKVICGMQQVGVGIPDVIEAWRWYYDNFGFDIKILDDEGVAERMLPYTGNKPQPRRAILAVNLQGGGGLEIWQPKGRKLNYLTSEANVGDYGIFACKIKSGNVDEAYKALLAKKVNCLCKPMTAPSGRLHFFLKDPYDNIFEIEQSDYKFVDEKKTNGGTNGAIMGVSNMDKSIVFYGKVLGFDKVEYDVSGVFDDLKCLPHGDNSVRRVLLGRTKPMSGPLSEIMGPAYIELVQNLSEPAKKLYEGRYWGDPGFIHLCFDVRNMKCIEEDCKAMGHPFVCDSGSDFGMGDADGWFTYIEDPDGTLIEFVETRKIPILKKFGIYLHLENKDDDKPLPRRITKALRFLRSKRP